MTKLEQELVDALEELLACVELTEDSLSRTNVAAAKAEAVIAKARGAARG